MPPIGPIARRDLVKYFRQLGFTGPYVRAKHPYMQKGDLVVTIPNAHQADISRGLLLDILRQAGIDRATWEAL